jgi:DnaK suppressor protein
MENIEQYRVKLQAEHDRLTLEMEENSKTQDFGSDVDGSSMDEETDEGEALANRLAIVQALKDELNEVEDALHRITAGTYGTCAQCGKPISKDILDAAPESALCADCKKAL